MDYLMALIGYARVSTTVQDEQTQVDALERAGCVRVFSERVSTREPIEKRPQLQAALTALIRDDVLVVTRLDRLGRSQAEVVARLHELQSRDVHVKTLDGLIDTQALGHLAPVVIGLLTGLAEVERELTRQRTLESIAYRRKRGQSLGGRPKAYTPEQADLVRRLRHEGQSFRAVSKAVGLSLGVVQRIVAIDSSSPVAKGK
jgi:DNA invertase Pin-like site-specific DNA recombinase